MISHPCRFDDDDVPPVSGHWRIERADPEPSIDGTEAIGAVTKTVPELMYTKSVTQVRQRYKVKFMEFLFARVTYP